MKTLLVLSPLPETADALRTELNPEDFRVIHRATEAEAGPLLTHGLAQAVILDAELHQVQTMWLIERLRRQAAQCPILVYSGGKPSDWEEEAYLRGATHVLSKPIRPRALVALLERGFTPAATQPVIMPPRPEANIPTTPVVGTNAPAPAQSLNVLRNFSSLLTHSLNADAMLRQFLLQLREIVSVNRAVIFLRPSATAEATQRLRAAGAIGIAPTLLEHFNLSLETGLGGQVFRLGRILRRHSDEVRADLAAQQEFERLGCQVAVPIFERDCLLGIAVFDGRITGEPLTNPELELIFHLLEQVGLAVRNIWLHDQLTGNNEMMAGVLRELSNACVVVNRDLRILHANKAARKYFSPSTRSNTELEFTDLPPALSAKVYQVLRSGTAIAPFKYEPEDAPGTVYRVTIAPLHQADSALPASALLVVDDQTQAEQLRRLEVEAAHLRLIKEMAGSLAHEIGNAIVPISIHQQLLAERYRDAEFRATLDSALAEGVRRVTRLTTTMRFLAHDQLINSQAIPLPTLIEEAYQEAGKYQTTKIAPLKLEKTSKPVVIQGDRAALKHALTEVLINALQANPTEPKVEVRWETGTNGTGLPGLRIEVQDNGPGFTPEALQKAVVPFFTTRKVGPGLGLTVSRKIIETHHGKLEIVPPASGNAGLVRITLPLDKAANPA